MPRGKAALAATSRTGIWDPTTTIVSPNPISASKRKELLLASTKPKPEAPISRPPASSPTTIGMRHEARSASSGPNSPTSTTNASSEKLTMATLATARHHAAGARCITVQPRAVSRTASTRGGSLGAELS